MITISIDNKIRNKWHKGFPRTEFISEIVLHGTEGLSTYSYVLNGGRKELYVKGVALFHYLIEVSGKVTEIISPDNYVFHSSSGQHDIKTIGIEIEKAKNVNDMNEEQLVSLCGLIEYLKIKYSSINTIATHDFNRKKYSNLDPKPCPGKVDWTRLKSYCEASKFVINFNI